MRHLAGLHLLILGLGDSGLAMAAWGQRHGAAAITVWDSREQPPRRADLHAQLPHAQFLHGDLSADVLQGVHLVLKSPGLSPLDARLQALLQRATGIGIPVQGELDLFARALADLKSECGYAPAVLAITGTNGKTTTTCMTAQLVERAGRRVAVAGNIGPSMLGLLGEAMDAQGLRSGPPSEVTSALALDAGGEVAVALVAPGFRDPDLSESASVPQAADLAQVLASDDGEADVAGAASEAAESEPAESGDAIAQDPVDATADVAADVTAGGDAPDASEATDAAEPAEAAEATVADERSDAAWLDAPLPIQPPPPRAPTFDHLPEVWVLELSSFQLDTVQGFEPTAAAVLNLTQDHLDWHGDMAAYGRAKARVFGTQAVMVINRDDAEVEAMVPAPVAVKGGRGRPTRWVSREVIRFGLNAPTHPGDYGLVTEGGMAWLVRAREADPTLKRRADEAEELVIQRLMPADALRVRGRHNAANAMAALALASAAGCGLAPMLHGLREYRGEPHRVAYVATVRGVDFYDDSKGTNVGATVAAITGLGADRAPARLVMILGGDGKGQDFSPLRDGIARHARAVALIGRDAPQIQAVLDGLALPIATFATLEEATAWAWSQAQSGDSVLLSPACASLDMFRNYAHRADVFVAEVQRLSDEEGLA